MHKLEYVRVEPRRRRQRWQPLLKTAGMAVLCFVLLCLVVGLLVYLIHFCSWDFGDQDSGGTHFTAS